MAHAASSSSGDPASTVDAAIRALRARQRLAAIERFIEHAAAVFARDLPGYDCDASYEDGELVGGDNYFEAGFAYIASRLRAAGVDPAEHEDSIDATLEHMREMSHDETLIAAGEQIGGLAEHARTVAALDRLRGLKQEPPPSLPRLTRALPMIAPNIVDTSIIWRTIGRAPRLATNQRSRGSRRAGAGARAGPDDPDGDSDPDGDRHPLAVGDSESGS